MINIITKTKNIVKSHYPKIIFFTLAAIFFSIFFGFKLNIYFSYDNLQPVYDFFTRFSFLGPVIIILLFIVFNIFAMPTFYFVFICGYLYGPWYGVTLAVVGMTAGMMTSFINARYIFRKDFQRKFGAHKMVVLIDQYTKKYKGWVVLFLRLFFIVPYNMQNIAYGLTSIHPVIYMVCSAIGIIPITVFYVVAGHLIKIDYMQVADLRYLFMGIGIALAGLITITVISILIKHKLVKENKNLVE